jgi:DNA repair photolyase
MRAIFRDYHDDETLRLDEYELKVNYGKNKFIFLGSSTDMFADAVPTEWILQVYDKCLRYPENKYLLQSKNPGRTLEPQLINHPLMQLKDRIYFATTIESNRDYPISKAQCMTERADAMAQLQAMGFSVMVTIEPIMDFDHDKLVEMLRKIGPFQVNIGCNTNREVKLPEPTRDQIVALVQELRTFTKVELKSNSARILGDLTNI